MTDKFLLIQAICDRLGEPLSGLDEVAAMVRVVTALPGQALFLSGQRATDVLFIRQGVVKLAYTTFEGVERIRDFVSEGQVVACVEALDGRGPAKYSAVACEPVEAEAIDFSLIAPRIATDPGWAHCAALYFWDTAINRGRREELLLTLSPPERYQKAISERPWLVERLTQQDLAAFVGVTPVSLSRLRKRERI
jgi:CRP-like cAMP-binding protein